MAGIYIHIPFCKTRRSYCDFYSQTSEAGIKQYVNAVCSELEFRKTYPENEPIETIYFGGGTPSRLSTSDFGKIFDVIYKIYETDSIKEVTIEANPDDLNAEYIGSLVQLPFNRISIGIQSFNDTELAFLNRRHSAEDAKTAVKRCKEAGFRNISIDLMYGIPHQTLKTWEESLNEALDLNVQHISAYHLIYEEGTKMYTLMKTGRLTPLDENSSIEMFSLMNSLLEENGFIHYEISNFAKEGYFSKHNSSYWCGKKYLGIGASAHSYDGKERSWNIASIKKYMEGINNGHPYFDSETLSLKDKYNDYILTRLRTMWGANTYEIEKLFGEKLLSYCLHNLSKYIISEDAEQINGQIKITPKGLFISDRIMSYLMYSH